MSKIKVNNQFRIVVELLEIVIIILALSWFAKIYILDFTQIKGDYMLPTLGHNNYIFIDKFTYKKSDQLYRGDVIVFYTDASKNNTSVKRVIGLAGDKVEIRNGFTYVNGKPLYEPYSHTPVTYEFPLIVVPENHIFVLNDNRFNKNDSRTSGSISQDILIGRALFCYWPWTKIKSL